MAKRYTLHASFIMEFITVILIAIGLAMDAVAVSVSSGAVIQDLKIKNALKIALFFGLFQTIMPIIGWFAGSSMRGFITGIDHFIAFGLLFLIGIKMIGESFKTPEERKGQDPLNNYTLFILAIATSIDALAVGITFGFLQLSLLISVIIIGAITFILSFVAVYVGRRFGGFFGKKVEIVGGLILIGIGVKILIEHMGN